MINAVIIDDEQNNIDNLLLLLKKHCPTVNVLESAREITTGRKIIQDLQPDIIFLDIQMPGGSGFDLLSKLGAIPCEIIFVTAYDKYAVQAFKFSALDYLLKPVDIASLKAAVKKAEVHLHIKRQDLHLKNLINLFHNKQKKDEHRIALASLKETRFVFTRQIIYCESSNNYTTCFLDSGEKIVASKPIYEFDEMLAEYGFIRCHQSYLVNKIYIKSLVKQDGSYYILLNDQTQIPVSRNKKEMLLTALQ